MIFFGDAIIMRNGFAGSSSDWTFQFWWKSIPFSSLEKYQKIYNIIQILGFKETNILYKFVCKFS